MASRFVRFAPSFGSDSDKNNSPAAAAAAANAAGGSAEDGTRRPSVSSAIEASMKDAARQHLSSRRSSNASNVSSSRRASTSSNVSSRRGSNASLMSETLLGGVSRVNTAIAANDGPSLAAALAQSIRHHARLIDGEQPAAALKQQQQQQQQGSAGGGILRTSKPAYDPYEDDDHVSLAPGVELNYEKEAPPSAKQEENATPPALRDYIANAGVEDTVDPRMDGSGRGISGGGGGGIDRSVERQQERINRMQDTSFGSRFRTNISNWFGIDTSEKVDTSFRSRAVRFAEDDDTVAIAAAIANGEAVPEAATFGIVGRAPKFIAPPATTFRTATRHPSHLPVSEYDDVESRLNAPRRMLAARKRHRRNDSFLRLMVAVMCFALSLTFAIIYGEGKFGLAVTTMAYERKIANRYDIDDSEDYHPSDHLSMQKSEGDVFYPDWWESEKGIPNMAAKGIKFSPTLEYNAADVSTPRAPDRIETPFFWFVPRSGGNAIRTIMSSCLRLAEASEYGRGSEQPFLIIEETEDRKYVNVDMTTSNGLKRAKDLKLASSGVPDVIISGDVHGVLKVFNNRNRARIFAVLRHPLDRAISKYYADLASDPEVGGMTLPQYVRSGGHRVENNYLTRYLSGQYGGKLEVKHLNIAREFLRRKFVVGLANDLPATSNLFSHVFGWNNTAASLGLENVDLCYNNIYNALSDRAPPSVEEGSEGWKLLVAQNWFDLKIYEYAEHLFQLQVDQLKLTSSAKLEDDVARI